MSGPGIFSGPPSNKAVGSTLAVAVTTLFWTIAAHTFWKTISTADMTLYITTSSVIITAFVSYFIGESGSYAQYRLDRIAAKSPPPASEKNSPVATPTEGRVQELEGKLQGVQAALQQLQSSMAQLGNVPVYAIPPPKQGAGG